MAQYSARERLIASVLSSTPRLKSVVKRCYILLNYAIHRKSYNYRLLISGTAIHIVEPTSKDHETFFGYYDKSPDNGSFIIFNETALSTSKKPNADKPLMINILNQDTGKAQTIAATHSYNWQQGCRTQWIDQNQFIYNDFNGQKYVCNLFNVAIGSVVKTFGHPVQDAFQDHYFLAVNYRRIMRLRPDYGYRNLARLSDADMMDMTHDGIWKVDFKSAQSELIVTLDEVASLQPRESFDGTHHKVNHVMISPGGDRFIFIHRWYRSGRRFDRLVLSDFHKLTVLSDNEMVSHMCWVDNDTLFGYLRHENRDGFYFINLIDGSFKSCEPLNNLSYGDGHPSCHEDWIVVDSYPDKSRMQHLTLYNWKTQEIKPLLEVFQPVGFLGESRCDLHPRFSSDGRRIYFDSVFGGSRRLCYIDIAND